MVKKILRVLRSPKLALGIFVYLVLFAGLATFIEGKTFARGPSEILAAFGLKSPYGSYWFIIPVFFLLLSTAFCSIARTKIALRRWRQMRGMTFDQLKKTGVDVGANADDRTKKSEKLLREYGFRTVQDNGQVHVMGRSLWALFASPFFHWMLVALIFVVLAGRLTRADGLMGVPVGQSRPFALQELVNPNVAPLYRWNKNPVRIGVSQLKVSYIVGGIQKGPTPLVTIYDSKGKALNSRLVYPNHTLSNSSLMVHYNDYGLALSVSLLDSNSKTLSQSTQLVDFDQSSSTGFTSSQFTLPANQGNPALNITLQLEPKLVDGKVVTTHFNEAQARITVTDATTGAATVNKVVTVGQSASLPDGNFLRFDELNYYARLSLVDDWSIPVIYVFCSLAVLGLSVALLTTPRVAYIGSSDDQVLVSLRFYRPTSVTTEEVLTELKAEESGEDVTQV